MKIYKYATIITAILTILSFVSALLLNFYTCVDPFWANALLGVFGSSGLTLLTSIIGYRVERRKTFEGFSYMTKAILHDLNKYQTSWDLSKKINYFLNYHDISKIECDRYYGEFSFLFDFRQKNRKYIYQKIYLPIHQVNQLINKHAWHFRFYEDGSGRNDRAVSKFVEEIEALIMETVKAEYAASGSDPEQKTVMTSTKNKLVFDVLNELNGEYYRLMYGNKVYRESSVPTQDE